MTINVPANSTVRYTLDSTDPNESSPVYAGPIEVETNTVIRARAYRDGVEASQIISETYLISVYHTMPVICLDDRSGQSDQRGIRRVRLRPER